MRCLLVSPTVCQVRKKSRVTAVQYGSSYTTAVEVSREAGVQLDDMDTVDNNVSYCTLISQGVVEESPFFVVAVGGGGSGQRSDSKSSEQSVAVRGHIFGLHY